MRWNRGVVISTGDYQICLDPQSSSIPYEHVFISHAHGDHVAGFYSTAVKHSTAETRMIHEARCSRHVDRFQPFSYGEKISVGDMEVLAHNAGHMLGSSQLQVFTPEESIVYTGDINCRRSLTSEAATPIECDTLIVEATYGDPVFIFPERETVYAEVVEWVVNQLSRRRTPVFHAYAAGKSQELMYLLNTFTEVPVVAHPITAKVSSVYGDVHRPLCFVDADSPEGKKLLGEGRCVYIAPTNTRRLPVERPSSAVVTGWCVKFQPRMTDAAFPLSGHADFRQLISYVKAASPSKAYVCAGHEESFASWLRSELGVPAYPIGSIAEEDSRPQSAGSGGTCTLDRWSTPRSRG